MQQQEVSQLQSLKSILLDITKHRKLFPINNSIPKEQFLFWLNTGIKDALSKGYLNKIILTIYTERTRPEEILESYTVEITSQLKEKLKDEEEVFKILKLLEPLPSTTYLSMRLVYNENCPEEYEPEGFKKAEFDYVMKGREVLVKDEIKIESQVAMKGESKRPEATSRQQQNSTIKNDEAEIKGKSYDQETNPRDNCLNDMRESGQEIPLRQNNQKGEQIQKDKKTTSIEKNSTNLNVNQPCNKDRGECSNLNNNKKPHNEETAKIDCICGINLNDLDMLQCDKCNAWSHTICCGYFSNNDKRISRIYTCNICLKNKILRLALYRRALSINYNEEILGVRWFSKRLGVGDKMASNLIKRMVSDGFLQLIPLNTRYKKYIAVKNESIKEKVKKYFCVRKIKHSLPVKDISMAQL